MSKNMHVLPISLRDAQTIHRALIDYRKLLIFSAYGRPEDAVISDEVRRVDALQERLSINVFYADNKKDVA
jgi:hypothetical protein